MIHINNGYPLVSLRYTNLLIVCMKVITNITDQTSEEHALLPVVS